MAFDPETCITAAQLRWAGVQVPKNVSDTAWIRRAAVIVQSVPRPPSSNAFISLACKVTFIEPFWWTPVS